MDFNNETDFEDVLKLSFIICMFLKNEITVDDLYRLLKDSQGVK